jgi:hypothetical protein
MNVCPRIITEKNKYLNDLKTKLIK